MKALELLQRRDLDMITRNMIVVLQERAEKAEAELAELRKAFSAAKAFIDAHVCDWDITPEMCEAWDKYQQELRTIGGEDEKSI